MDLTFGGGGHVSHSTNGCIHSVIWGTVGLDLLHDRSLSSGRVIQTSGQKGLATKVIVTQLGDIDELFLAACWQFLISKFSQWLDYIITYILSCMCQ